MDKFIGKLEQLKKEVEAKFLKKLGETKTKANIEGIERA